MPDSLIQFDHAFRRNGVKLLAGMDEAGRGPLAGPVVIAAVIMPPDFYHPLINDSKKLKEQDRYRLEPLIYKYALDYSLIVVPVEFIDKVNIRNATLKGMEMAVKRLQIKPETVLIDGESIGFPDIKSEKVVKGDSQSFSIACASILAKTFRDRIMIKMDRLYPVYDFKKHKGYGTEYHRTKIKEHGPCPIHRRSFIKKMKDW
ncbi:MAG: ribonuclease HII [Calditrichia bacterium]